MTYLQAVKDRIWFYEFDLPDGTKTQTDIPPEVRRIHTSRLDKLRWIIKERIPDAADLTALDFGSHEGYFSIEMAKHFSFVRGIEIKQESIDAACQIAEVLGVSNVAYMQADLQRMQRHNTLSADLVLVYGVLYHLENPIYTLQLASAMSRKHILIETQIFPYNIMGTIEDGSYLWQRKVEGVFGLSVDYSERREGGSTNLALVPSLNALIFLLRMFGFQHTEILDGGPDDYEQFSRGSRVVIYGCKSPA